jgi:hypothetical protein
VVRGLVLSLGDEQFTAAFIAIGMPYFEVI